MGALALLSWLLLLWCPGTSGSAVLTQTPAFLSVTPGDSISILCRASQSVSDYLNWYQQKPGQIPRILIYDADDRFTGVSDRFTAIQDGTEFIFKISKVEVGDAGTYYCQQSYAVPPTVLQPHT